MHKSIDAITQSPTQNAAIAKLLPSIELKWKPAQADQAQTDDQRYPAQPITRVTKKTKSRTFVRDVGEMKHWLP